MDEYTYKFVPFIPRLKLGVFGIQNAEAISTQLDALVRTHAADGWEYVRLEQVSVVHAAGCLATLFGKGSHSVDYDLVVLRMSRAVIEATVAAAGAVNDTAPTDSAAQASSPRRPVPDTVRALYSAATDLYAAWFRLGSGDDAFMDEDEVLAARNAFLEALEQVGDQCAQEESGVGAAVARKAESDFSAMLGDAGFAAVIERLESHA